MRILLAGPGTGKTTRIKRIIDEEFKAARRILVLSFTNFTVNDLGQKFAPPNYDNVECATLHKFAMKLNHLTNYHILSLRETKLIEKLAEKLELEIDQVFEVLRCITFDSMISSCLDFMAVNPRHIGEKLGNVDLLIVDEFQDFNPIEQKLVHEISKIAGETIILGDDDQSIYGFKDADPDGILALYADDINPKIDHEHNCYRCPGAVVEHATELILKNKKRVAKPWNPMGIAGTVTFTQHADLVASSKAILDEILRIKKEESECSVLVLTRWKVIVEKLKQLLEGEKVPYVDCWFEDLPDEKYELLWWFNAIFGWSPWPFLIFLLKLNGNLIKSKALPLIVEAFQKGFNHKVVEQIRDRRFLPEPQINYLFEKPSLQDFLQSHPEFNELLPYIDTDDLEGSVGTISKRMAPGQDFEEGKVNLMSIHKSKGLQADHVIIDGLVAGILPNEASGFESIEAERRLLYVAITRALKSLSLHSTTDWDNATLMQNGADKSQFEYRWIKRVWKGKSSKFLSDMNVSGS